MGQAALMMFEGRRWRWWLRRAGIGVFVVLGLHLLARFLVEAPVMRYIATCGADMFERTYIEGPYNELFLHRLEKLMASDNFVYARKNGAIYVPYLGFYGPEFNGYLLFEGYDDFSLNTDWKIVSDIADGTEIVGGSIPPPSGLAALIEATEPKYGPFPRRTDTGERIHGPDPRFHDSEDACAFMRTAILQEPDDQGKP